MLQSTATENNAVIQLPEPKFPNQEAYRAYCHGVVAAYRATNTTEPLTPTFGSHLNAIHQGGEMVIKTGWGGVDIRNHTHPKVEKFLVVQAGQFLAFEKHDEKIETLYGEEGLGILVYRPQESTSLKAEFIKPGWSITLSPGQEHTIIALSDLLVLESSIDPKGMDQDLIFLFMPTDA